MNAINQQKELLLLVHSSFFADTWVKKNNAEADSWFSQREQLKDACWSGITPELLPECFDNTIKKNAPLWKINEANTFIELVFSNQTQEEEKQFSLNPYIFMQVQEMN